MYKAQVQVDQGLPHKIKYTESNKREMQEKPGIQQHRGKFPEPMVQALGSSIDRWDLMKLRSCKAKYIANKTKL